MRIHIIGICGTFMGGVALLARAMGHDVSGSDEKVYAPMSTLLQEQGIVAIQGYAPGNLAHEPELVVIGNALSRGNPEVEAVLDRGLPYISGAQWLAENVLAHRWTIAVAGTHGKTSTSSMLAWILEAAGLSPGFLIGGVPLNFGVSARLGQSPFFVIEADEYDTAFFDKRSKFVHYRPRTVVLNNLEYDHADIFKDLEAIETQFHHLVRTVPASGRLVINREDNALAEVIDRGCWSETEYFNDETQWCALATEPDVSGFEILYSGAVLGEVRWSLIGEHNMSNALAAVAAARHAGVDPGEAIAALADFRNARRRLELRYEASGIRLFDDFAHHPTEIAVTLRALRHNIGKGRLFAIFEPRSNTMRMGVHQETLAKALELADHVEIFHNPGISWDIGKMAKRNPDRLHIGESVGEIVDRVTKMAKPGDQVVVMSNGGFEGIHELFINRFDALDGT